jgi:O-antigen ligase
MAALGVYFLRRFGRRGLFAAAFLAIPLLLLGGRSGSKAQSSSEERLECWHEALEMWRSNPFIGVGQGRFTDYHYLTAHNSFLLALAELGPLGLFTWTAVLYVAFKGLIRIQIDFKDRPEAASARTWATALLASLAGLAVSSVFLSVTYHVVVWTFLGLAAGLYGIVRRHAPEWHIKFGLRDLLYIAGIDVALIVFLTVYLRIKGV